MTVAPRPGEPLAAPSPATEPLWPSADALAGVTARLAASAPLVTPADCADLRTQLAAVASGAAHLVQGGDCAELFDEVSAHTTRRKAAQLTELADLVEIATAVPALTVGRIAGQFAKPRSSAVERLPDGGSLPVYRGDAVNALEADPAARVPDPARLLTARERAASIHATLDVLAAASGRRVFTSHEALLLDYENALVRPAASGPYGGSAHLLWAGERTRDPAGPHIGLLSRITNPVAVKLGPATAREDLQALIDVLDPQRTPGRLSFVARMGAGHVRRVLPALAGAAREAGCLPVWICDPMHGNGQRAASGRKIRLVDDVRTEVAGFVAALREAGAHPGGIHLELTPDDVTECVDLPDDPTPRYWTGCDPRLNPAQARDVVRAFAAAVSP
ncbi:3-deoxy-7-phosphoheptulonate synthase [Amycolatopsis sp. DG1A-15b]|uniref:3-deoxy-7-phosphoheptulonate synthase n=1 Tax=Amycolatopsis sp. DG1A-15b TaxID=3052846 RepID=UPI00255C275C|nr:3-deoxy-7-phosphoheptulonate synthase [Amycolatopsis sp. DG1A-15b]WIX91439.1 3-deoxy-7-phosphoheptulonate synthase [Amycolatopsis sp. DG1A-15b]